MFCPRCGTQSLEQRNYCHRCGTNLRLVTEALSDEVTSAPDVEAESRASERRAELEIAKREIIRGAVYLFASQGATLITGHSFWGLGLVFSIIGIIKLIKGLADYASAYSAAEATDKPSVETNPLASGATRPNQLTEAASPLFAPPSIVEQTTRRLPDYAPPRQTPRSL